MGKLVGSMCCISGIFVISLPIPIIVGTFAESYKENKTRERELRKKLLIQSTRKTLAFFHPYCNGGGGGERRQVSD